MTLMIDFDFIALNIIRSTMTFKENGRDTEINVILHAYFPENVEHILFEYM